jgi:hypothetical protein
LDRCSCESSQPISEQEERSNRKNPCHAMVSWARSHALHLPPRSAGAYLFQFPRFSRGVARFHAAELPRVVDGGCPARQSRQPIIEEIQIRGLGDY